ncbi:MAG: hypothetical protein VYB54_09610 [Pseudomonadota bacterium]|nr:hypothetical protein [Pseudomonadota bacterium]
MAGFGGGGDTAALAAATRREQEQARRLEDENKARVRNLRSRTSGRRALLAFVDDVPGDGLKTTLG